MKLSRRHEKNVFVVISNTDLTEGRGQEYAKHICTLQATANRLAIGQYVMGTDCKVVTGKTFALYDDETLIGWFGPCGKIEQGTDVDIYNEKLLKEDAIKAQKKNAALEKARKAGLSEDDIKALLN